MGASPASSFRPAVRAFSIVELMVAIAVLTLLVVMLTMVFQQVSRTYLQGEQGIERRRGARVLTDYIGVELQGAMLPAEGGAVAPGRSNLQFVINPPETQVPAECRFADAIFWQAPLATEASYGEIAEIGYFVRWVNPSPAAARRGVAGPRPALCRFFVNPSVPAPGGAAAARAVLPNPDFLIYRGATPEAWLSEPLLRRIAWGEAPAFAGLFGENVVGLWIRAYGLGTDPVDRSKPQELPRSFYSLPRTANDLTVGYVHTRTYLNATGGIATKQERYYLPARVQVSIAHLDRQHAERLDACRLKVQALTKRADIRDAAEFLAGLQREAASDASLAALLPGMRTYSTEVALQNAR